MPDEFLRQDFEDTIIAINGYIEEKIDEERIFRRLGVMAVSPYVDKNFDIYKYWPIANDEELSKGIKDAHHDRLLSKLRRMRLEDQQKKQNGKS